MKAEDNPRQIGKYQIVRKLGGGGMALVYDAYDPEMDRHVALKVMRDRYEDDTAMAERFVQEAQRLASLEEHGAILPVYEVGRDGTYLYIAMRKCDGPSLADLIQRKGILTTEQVRTILGRVGGALQFAHDRNLVHCDVKPSNILLDRSGKAYLTDFGISRALRDTLRGQGDGPTGYTPRYASPEQARGDRVDVRSDIFSLGVVLYEMCTGRVPWRDGSTPSEWRELIGSAPIPPPRSLNPNIDENLEKVLLHALERDPNRRFARPLDLVHAVLNATAPHVPVVHGTRPLPPLDRKEGGGPLREDPAGTTPPRARLGRRGPFLTRRKAMLTAIVIGLGSLSAWAFAERESLASWWRNGLDTVDARQAEEGSRTIEEPSSLPPSDPSREPANPSPFVLASRRLEPRETPSAHPVPHEEIRVLLSFETRSTTARGVLPAVLHEFGDRLRAAEFVADVRSEDEPRTSEAASLLLAGGGEHVSIHFVVDAYLRPAGLSYLPATPVIAEAGGSIRWRDEGQESSFLFSKPIGDSLDTLEGDDEQRLRAALERHFSQGLETVVARLEERLRAREERGRPVELILVDPLGDPALAREIEAILLRSAGLTDPGTFEVLEDGRSPREGDPHSRPFHVERGIAVTSRERRPENLEAPLPKLVLFSTDATRTLDEPALRFLREFLPVSEVEWVCAENVPPAWFDAMADRPGWHLLGPPDRETRLAMRRLRTRLEAIEIGDDASTANSWSPTLNSASLDLDDRVLCLGFGGGGPARNAPVEGAPSEELQRTWRWRLLWRSDFDSLQEHLAFALHQVLGERVRWRFERNGIRLTCALWTS